MCGSMDFETTSRKRQSAINGLIGRRLLCAADKLGFWTVPMSRVFCASDATATVDRLT